MRLFGKKETAIQKFSSLLENQDLLFVSYDKNIPETGHGARIIYNISIDENGKVNVNSTNDEKPDPSTIYVHLPIKQPNGETELLPYWPHYIDISPEQRFVYLNWLRNIEQPIDMGYIFLYYYGLEKHLLIGNFEKAFNQIIKLRNIHRNKSFQNYSEAALIHSCILKGKEELLIDLHEKTEISHFSNAQFSIAHKLNLKLSSVNLLNIFKKHIYLSRKPIKENPTLLLKFIENSLTTKYGEPSFPFSNSFDFSKTNLTTESRFCNYSFPDEIRHVELTDYYSHKPLMKEVVTIFNLAYDSYKVSLRRPTTVFRLNL